MRGKLVSQLLISSLTVLFVAVSATGASSADGQINTANELQEVSFSLTRLPENPKLYSLVFSDTDEHVISGSFSVDRLQILTAIMTEAETFALSGEAVGDKDAITTRFTDKFESAFIVDVEKVGNQSRLFLTIKTENGSMTMNSGRVIRSSRREEGFFFDLLSRLESTLPKLPAQPAK